MNDIASVTNSSVPGSISITQKDIAGNTPWYNTAMLSDDSARGNLSISQGNAGGWIDPKTGTPTPGDQATVNDGSTAGGNITIRPGHGSQ